MSTLQEHTNGLKRLVEKCRNEFRRAENTDYYSKEDFREAEKKYVRFCLTGDPFYSDQ
ncbi:MAG: hypothetical protein K9L59_12560 [Desulfobacterales bacterium]|nr:hypothetical protein [Desulfobacterales bacterium]MCF8080010.1 hypothetical protein [Desulfobacterales bacterium]